MSKRYFVHLAYKGTHYHGWQRQTSDLKTIQSELEDKLSKILGQKMVIVGCGRTDKGVHASKYFAHFDYESEWEFDLVKRWNRTLAPDISIKEVFPVSEKAHSRYDATERSYTYYFHVQRDPFLDEFSTFWEVQDFDLETMRKAIFLLPQYKEYRAFCLTPDKHNTTLCEVYEASLEKVNEQQWAFNIKANRYLKGMIRRIMYALMQIGTGQLSISKFENCLKSGQAYPGIKSAYPQGLFLSEVEYPYNVTVKTASEQSEDSDPRSDCD